MKFVILSFVTMLITSCVTSTSLPDNTVLERSEGVVIANVSCNNKLSMASIYKSGTGWSRAKGIHERVGFIKCSNTYNTLKLPSGSYYISSFLGKGFVNTPEEKSIKFSVIADTINYIGDFDIQMTEPTEKPPAIAGLIAPVITSLLIDDIENFGQIRILVQDNVTEARDYIQTNLPSMYKSYPLKSNIAYKQK